MQINLQGDTISTVCGNGDGISYCGSDGTGARISFLYTDQQDEIFMPYSLFNWDGQNLIF